MSLPDSTCPPLTTAPGRFGTRQRTSRSVVLSPWRLSLVVLLCLAAVACRRPPAADPQGEVVQRLLREEGTLLQRGDLFDAQAAFVWGFPSEEDLAAWQVHNVEKLEIVDGSLSLLAGDDPQLIREVTLQADAVHAIKVVVQGPIRGRPELFWAAKGEPFSADRRWTVEPDSDPQSHGTYLLEVASHPEWRGEIARLRLDPTTLAGETVQLVSVTGVRRVPNAARLSNALSRSWKVDLEADVRNAWLAVPGTQREVALEVASGRQLSFAYGLETGTSHPVTFRIEAEADDGTSQQIFQALVDPAGQAGYWHEATVGLTAFAGRTLRLRFGTESSRHLDLAKGFPAWAHPEILGPSPEDPLPNVVLLSIDTLRADHLSSYGYSRRTSPNIDAWAAESAVLFRNTVVQAPWTLPSHASLFTGLDAVRHGVNHYGEAPLSLEMLAEILREAGYATVAFTGGGYLRPQFGLAQGFDRFQYWPEVAGDEELARGMESALTWLDHNRGRRFFLFFHTYEVHYPHRRRLPYFLNLAGWEEQRQVTTQFEMKTHDWEGDRMTWGGDYLVARHFGSESFSEELTDEEKELVVTLYDSAVAYMDAQVGRLLTRLEELGLRGRTLILLTSDHGEALGEQGLAGHNYLSEDNLMVPLVVELPGRRAAGRVVDEQVRSIDVVPTVLDVLGLGGPEAMDGVSLLKLLEDPDSFPADAWTYASSANYGLSLRRRNRLKYELNNSAWSQVLGSEQLYDLVRDPLEQSDVAASHESIPRLREQVREHLDSLHTGVRMKIYNRGPGTLTGHLWGEWIALTRVKTDDLECRCLHWDTVQGASFSLAAGQETTLYFEAARDVLELGGTFSEPGGGRTVPFQERFSREQLAESPGLELRGSAWRRGTGKAQDAVAGFVLWEVGTGPQGVTVPEDDGLLEQLRALGYVE